MNHINMTVAICLSLFALNCAEHTSSYAAASPDAHVWVPTDRAPIDFAGMLPRVLIRDAEYTGRRISIDWYPDVNEFRLEWSGRFSGFVPAGVDPNGMIHFRSPDAGIAGVIDLRRDGHFQIDVTDDTGRSTRFVVDALGMILDGKECVCVGMTPDICTPIRCDIQQICPLGQGTCMWVSR